MRGLPLALLFAACTAPPEDEEAPHSYCWPVFNTTHDMVWSAARKGAVWVGEVVHVDTTSWEIRCANGTVWQASPWRSG
jgi:hypothetical protein